MKSRRLISLTAHTYSAEPLLVAKGIWNKLPEKYQQAIQEAATEACSWQRDLCAGSSRTSIGTKIRESGKSEINDDVDKAAFMDATKPVWAMFEEKLGKQNIEAIVNVQ